MPWNIPIFLTWMRVLLIPAFTALFYLPDAWIHPQTVNWTAAFIFAAAAVTDWFDGFLARLWKQTSDFGAFLDPVADKLMVAVALLLLVDIERTNVIFAIIIIGREITISALREWMASIGARKSVAVNWMGKVKTAVQMLAIPMLLYHDPIGSFDCQYWGSWMITLAAIQTFISMAYYLKQAWPQLRGDTGAH